MRYQRNIGAITEEEQRELGKKRVLVVGCGGLGGFVVEGLARIGVGNIIAVDKDVFDHTNLNRQIFSSESKIGLDKVQVAKERINDINKEVLFEGIKDDIRNIKIHNIDVIFDCTDNFGTKLYLKSLSNAMGVPLVTGSVGGWYGIIGIHRPNDTFLDKVYKENLLGIEKNLGNQFYIVSLISSLQLSEGIKLILNKGDILNKSILYVDLKNLEFEIINF